MQGHPQLLKLAEAQAKTADNLREHLQRAEMAETAGAGKLDAFFLTGESTLGAHEFLRALYAWTRSVSGTLTEGARRLFYHLCCLEERDRQKQIIEMVWGDIAAQALELAAAGLMDSEYRIHPGVAEAGRENAGPKLRKEVDEHLAEFWITIWAKSKTNKSDSVGSVVLTAARSAVPYLMRQHRWDQAAALIEQMIGLDMSPSTVAEALPLLVRIM